MREDIILNCDSCGREQDYARTIDCTLPYNVRFIRSSKCDECDNGDFGSERWFDEDGRELSQDETLWARGAAPPLDCPAQTPPRGDD